MKILFIIGLLLIGYVQYAVAKADNASPHHTTVLAAIGNTLFPDSTFREVMIEELTQLAQHRIVGGYDTSTIVAIGVSDEKKQVAVIFDNEDKSQPTTVLFNEQGVEVNP